MNIRFWSHPIQRKSLHRFPIQAKLNIGEPNDKYEQEADATASKVVQQINSPTQDKSVQREAMEEEEELQMKSLVQRRENLGGGEASTDLESSIQNARGSGQPLDPTLQTQMEQAMGADFSGVKVHIDSQADHLNKSIQAKAFTTGQDVFFQQGAYNPMSTDGQELIAHELTHVVQQNGENVMRSPQMLEPYQENTVSDVQSITPVQRMLIQRLNGANPINFRVTNSTADDTECSVTTDLAWDSSNSVTADLADFQSREEVTFNADPRVNMPAYAGPLPFGMQLNGNVLTKPVGVMSNPGGRDKHSGAAHGTKFTVGGVANLQRGAWTLVGTQYYQTKQNGGAWINAAGPFIITRTMQQNGDQFSLTISKVGPNCMVAAGPTPITIETSTAMQNVGAARVDQTGEWNTAQATLANAGGNKPALHFNAIATDVRNNAQGVAINVDYEYTSCANPLHPFAAAYDIPQQWRNTLYQQSRSAARGIIDNVLNGAHPPTRFIITIFRCAGVQQQALWTNENGGTYRVLLRADKLMDMGQWGGDVNTSMAGRESKHGWTDQGKKERFAKTVVTHELGHMLHAVSSPEKFLTSTLMPANILQIQNAVPPDPLADEKIHICNINGQVIQALNGKGYKQKWGYAMGNPGEVVPEVFAAIQNGRNVPQGLAAVYVAYGGIRGGNIDAALQQSFGGAIPTINEPEACIPIINAS